MSGSPLLSLLPDEAGCAAASGEEVRPRLSPLCEIYPFDGGDDREEYLLRAPGGRQLRIGPAARQLLERLDGRSSLAEVAAELGGQGMALSAENLRAVLTPYARAGAIEGWDEPPAGDAGAPPAAAAPRSAVHALPFLITFDLVPARWVQRIAVLTGRLFAPAAVVLSLIAIAVAHVVVYARADWRLAAVDASGYALMVSLALATIVVHELGHAGALHRYGGRPGPIGFGLYLLMPTFYADVSEIWRFRRRQRMVVDVGGPYLHQLCFVVLAALYAWTGRPELAATAVVVDLMVLMSLNPLFRFDGYWLLADYLAIPRLQQAALAESGGWFLRLVGRPAPRTPERLRGARRVVFRAYSLFAGVFLVAIGWLLYNYLSSAILRLPEAVPGAWEGLVEAVAARQPGAAAGGALTLAFLVGFPATAAIGALFYLRRLAGLVAGLPSIRRMRARLRPGHGSA